MSEPVLEFRSVVLPPVEGEARLAPMSFALAPGQLGWISLSRTHALLPWADTACGIAEPLEGEVLFLGRPWLRYGAFGEAAARGLIGQVFSGPAWISNLDLDENIVLASVHQGRRDRGACVAESTALAASLGLAPLPAKRPAALTPRESHLGQWTRALLGRKDLILLEGPAGTLSPKDLKRCASALALCLEQGTAALVLDRPDRTEWLRDLPLAFTIKPQDVLAETP
jgi:predicted ABC-type transport system involved in lysophospholipase L1 biosynthesis ATPase subunit